MSFLEEIVESKQDAAREKNVKLELCCSPDVPSSFRSDTKHMTKILDLLINRAIRHSRDTSVTIDASLDRNEIWKQPALQFQVTDHSSVIRTSDFESLFDLFFHPADEASGGTGLDLALAQRLAQVIGADVTVSSDAESGTTFALTMMSEVRAAAEAE